MNTSPHTGPTPTGSLPRRVDVLLAHYGQSHQNPRTELIHFVAIPAIMLSRVGATFSLHLWVAGAFVVTSLLYQARLSLVFFIAMAFFWICGHVGAD